MPETAPLTRELLCTDDFSYRLTDWQSASISYVKSAEALYADLHAQHSGPDISPNDSDSSVSNILDALDDEQPHNVYVEGLEGSTKLAYDRRQNANGRRNEAGLEMIDFCAGQGMNQFALFGLKNFIDVHPHDFTFTALSNRVTVTEERLTFLDNLLQSNPNELLSVIQRPRYMTVGRIGIGAVTIVGRNAVLPLAGGKVFATNFSHSMPELYVEDTFEVDAHHIVNEIPLLLQSSDVADMSKWQQRRSYFVVGEIPPIEPILTANNPEHSRYERALYDRLVTTVRQATLQH